MAEQIIDIRERIEKMRIKIEEEQILGLSEDTEVLKEEKILNNNDFKVTEPESLNNKITNNNNVLNLKDNEIESKGSFPQVSLSVKNPISTKILVFLMILQILSNICILYLLYTLLE